MGRKLVVGLTLSSDGHRTA